MPFFFSWKERKILPLLILFCFLFLFQQNIKLKRISLLQPCQINFRVDIGLRRALKMLRIDGVSTCIVYNVNKTNYLCSSRFEMHDCYDNKVVEIRLDTWSDTCSSHRDKIYRFVQSFSNSIWLVLLKCVIRLQYIRM